MLHERPLVTDVGNWGLGAESIGNAHNRIRATVMDIDDVPTSKREDCINTLCLLSFGDKVADRDSCIGRQHFILFKKSFKLTKLKIQSKKATFFSTCAAKFNVCSRTSFPAKSAS